MKELKKIAVVFMAILILAMLFTSCEEAAEELVDALTSVNGTVVDARSATLAGISGVTVTLLDESGSVVDTDTTDTDGEYVLDYEEDGLYTITAALTGYAFISLEDITIGGLLQDMPNIAGVAYVADTDISLITLWDSDYMDVDMHFTYPSDNEGDGQLEDADADYGTYEPTLIEHIFANTGGTTTTGFWPVSGLTNREIINVDNPADNTTTGLYYGDDSTDPTIQMDRDDRNGSGPETITIKTPPYVYGDLDSSTYLASWPMATPLGIDDGSTTTDWNMIGIGELYLNAFHSTDTEATATDGSDLDEAHPVVYITQGSSVLGKVVIPEMNVSQLSVLRMGIYEGYNTDGDLYPFYLVFYTDIRQIAANDYRSVIAADTPDYQVVAACPMTR